MSRTSGEPNIAILVLAAGGSTRMGVPKQFLAFRGKSLLRRAAEAALASPCRPVCIVLGAFADRLLPEVESLPVLVTQNPEWKTGMASSIRAGLEALLAKASRIQGVVITLCDQPGVTDRTISRLLAARRSSGPPVIASRYHGTRGVPALFSRRLFPRLLSLEGSGGARQLIAQGGYEVEGIAAPEAALDVDTPEDYASLAASAAALDAATIARADDPRAALQGPPRPGDRQERSTQ